MTDVNKPSHALLVEDDPAQAELILLSMEDDRVTNTVDHVGDGAEAMAYLRQEGDYAQAKRPDVVFLDLNLPKLSGHEVLKQVKSDPALSQIPVVILTSSASESDRAKAYAHHANSFLVKPVDFAKFQQMCRDLRLYWAVWNQPPVAGSSFRYAV